MPTQQDSEKAPTLLTRDQRMLSALNRLLQSNPQLQKRFESTMEDRGLQQLQGLTRRSGLLQTVLFLVRKHNDVAKSAREKFNKGKANLRYIAALELVSTVLKELWAEEGQALEGLFSRLDTQSEVYYMNPLVLGGLHRTTYQRLSLDVLHLTELAAGLAESWTVLKALDEVGDQGGVRP